MGQKLMAASLWGGGGESKRRQRLSGSGTFACVFLYVYAADKVFMRSLRYSLK